MVLAGKTAYTLSTRIASIDDGKQAKQIQKEITALSQEKMTLSTRIAEAYSLQSIHTEQLASVYSPIQKPVVLNRQATLALLQ